MAYTKFSDFTIFDPPDISDYLVGYRELGGEFRASLQTVTDVVKQFVSPTLSNTLFVNMSGNDSALGNSEPFAFRTIKRAMAKALEISRSIPQNAKDFEDMNGWGTYPNTVNVYVRAGDYVEDNPIYVPPGVTVIGENSRSVTVIPKNKFYDIFWVNNKTSIQGLTFKEYYSPAYAVAYPEFGRLNGLSVAEYPSTRIMEATAKASYYYALDFAKYPITKLSKSSFLNFNVDAGQIVLDPFRIAFLGRYFKGFDRNEIFFTTEESVKQKEFWETEYYNLSSAVERPFTINPPYIFNCYTITTPTESTARDAGGTIYVNGNLADGPLRSMTIESCEHFNQGGKGVHVSNNGLINVIDNSTICCTEGIIATDGGTAVVNGSNSTFGLSGLVSIGKSPKPTMVGTLKFSILSGVDTDTFVITNLGSPDLSANQQFPKNKKPYVGQVFQIIDQNYTVLSSGINYLSANNSGTFFVVQSASNLRPALFPSKGYECDVIVEKVYSLSADVSVTGKTYIPSVDALNSGSNVLFYVRSSILAYSHTFDNVGTGINFLSAIPQDAVIGDDSKETNHDLVGKILFNSINKTGNVNFGNDIILNQVEGKINAKTLVSNDAITSTLTAYDSVNIGNVKYNNQQGVGYPSLNIVRTSDDRIIAIESINDNSNGNNVRSFYARGNQSLKKALSADDDIIRITGFSHNGINYPNYGAGGNASIRFIAAGDQSSTNAGAYISLHTTRMETISTTSERMRIADNGFVGINTTNPLSTLHVEGSLLVTENLNVSANSTFNNLNVTLLSALSSYIQNSVIDKSKIQDLSVSFLSADNTLIRNLTSDVSYFNILTANNARVLSAYSDYIYSDKTETLFLSALSSNLNYIYTNKIIADEFIISDLSIGNLTLAYLSALSADIDTTSSLRVSGDINVRDIIYTSNGSSENWTSTYITVSALSALWGDESGAVSKLYVDSKFLPISAGTSTSTYTTNLTVSLPNGKTFGRYGDGEIIPAIGKTPKDIIQMSISEPIAPVASLTSPTTIAFNQTAISNTLNFSYIIKSLGASVDSVSLEWRRNGSGAWTQLSSNTGLVTYNHVLTDSSFNNQSFNYKYIVTDTFAATVTASLNITPASYVAPTIPAPTIVAASGTTSPETNTTREKGNINTNISGSITRNSPYVNLNSYQLQYNVNGSGWVDIGTPTTISGSSYTITSTNHNPTASNNANNIAYRVKVIDDFQTTYSSATTITFYNIIFYGSSVSTPTNSTQVRNNLTNRIFTNGSNPFILNTGTTNTRFTVAMPNTLSISSVIDLDSLNANITNTYINNPFTVDDYYGNAVSYKVYTLQVGTPYSPSHRHQVTR